MAGVSTGPPKVLGLPNPASSISTSSTFGAPSGGDGVMLMVQSACDCASVRPMVPPKDGSGIGSTVRSGLNLPAAVASASLSAPMVWCSIWATDFIGEPGSASSAASRSAWLTTAMMPAEPGGSCSPMPVWMPLATRCRANAPATPPAAAPTTTEASNGGENRPTTAPTPPPQPSPLRPRWSPVSVTRTSPSSSCSTRITPSVRTLLSLTSCTSPSKSCRASPTDG